eukprot:ctg_713.g438
MNRLVGGVGLRRVARAWSTSGVRERQCRGGTDLWTGRRGDFERRPPPPALPAGAQPLAIRQLHIPARHRGGRSRWRSGLATAIAGGDETRGGGSTGRVARQFAHHNSAPAPGPLHLLSCSRLRMAVGDHPPRGAGGESRRPHRLLQRARRAYTTRLIHARGAHHTGPDRPQHGGVSGVEVARGRTAVHVATFRLLARVPVRRPHPHPLHLLHIAHGPAASDGQHVPAGQLWHGRVQGDRLVALSRPVRGRRAGVLAGESVVQTRSVVGRGVGRCERQRDGHPGDVRHAVSALVAIRDGREDDRARGMSAVGAV